MQQHFIIENYRFIEKTNSILVSIKRGTVAIPITIPKEQFEFWLKTAQRLITSIILNDPQKGKQIADSIMNLEEYWKLGDKEVHGDLYDYIVSHPIEFRGQVYENPLASINYGFNKHMVAQN